MKIPNRIEKVVEHMGRLPGIGPKSALRHSLSLMNWKTDELNSFGKAIHDLTLIKECDHCGVYCDFDRCEICKDPKRAENKVLCVVESMTDCLAIENAGQFHGVYHVLGGVLNPLLGIGPIELKLDHLFSRIKEQDVKEVILAVNPSVEGDATCSFIRQNLPNPIQVERIGFGIPMGGHLEYLDSLTIAKALENRKEI